MAKVTAEDRTPEGRRGMAQWVFAALFVVGGFAHFVATGVYETMMPSYIPWHRPLVFASGIVEIGLGILLLVARFTRMAAWGLVALLIAVFPANIHVYQHQELFHVPPLVHWLRLPLQAVLIYWAWVYTRRSESLTRPGPETTG